MADSNGLSSGALLTLILLLSGCSGENADSPYQAPSHQAPSLGQTLIGQVQNQQTQSQQPETDIRSAQPSNAEDDSSAPEVASTKADNNKTDSVEITPESAPRPAPIDEFSPTDSFAPVDIYEPVEITDSTVATDVTPVIDTEVSTDLISQGRPPKPTAPETTAPKPTKQEPTAQVSEPQESPVAIALRTGNALVVENANDLIDATIAQIEHNRTRFDTDIQTLFALDEENSITSIDWDPTHDAATLIPTYGVNTSVLFTNNVTTDSNTVYEKSIGVIGNQPTRYMALGSNPMRNGFRNPDSVSPSMHAFMINSIHWLTNPEPDLQTNPETTNNSALNIVIAHMDDSYYFPDETATRAWLDENIINGVNYNEEDTCDDSNLSQCLTDDTDLLIISQIASESTLADEVATTVRKAMQSGTPVLYMHHNGNITDLGLALFNELNISYEWDNYWKRLQLSNYDITDFLGQVPDSIIAIQTLLEHLLQRDYQFDWSLCDDENCSEVPGLYSEFESGASAVRSILNRLDNNNHNIFTNDDQIFQKLLALTGDHLRQQVVFPMDKVTTDDNTFLRSYYADHAVYYSRDINPPQPDMGNFSRSDFNHIVPDNKTVSVESRQPFRSTGVYALPGKTLVATRTDQSDVEVQLFVNTQRSGSTHQWATDGYTRPKFLRSPSISLAPGESVSMTSPYGGPVQLSFSTNDLPVVIDFQNVGEHPHWNGTQHNTKFAQQLIDGHFDWAEIVTPGFEVHSSLDNMRNSVNDSKWGDAQALATATTNYLYNFPHVLAGFTGHGIDSVDEIHDFAARKGFTMENIDKVKHMNADQATCGYGCSGNPYDAYWSFDPLGHGDLHELGHGLEKKRLRFEGWPGHASTNHYSYYTKSQYFKNTGGDPECQSLPFENIFDVLQASWLADDPQAYIQQNMWDNNAWSDGAAMIIQMMMAAEDNGALLDGWHLLARLHIIEREFSRALSSDEQWTAAQQNLGMGRYTLTQAKEISRNDWLLIALGVATDLDWRHYLTTWAIPYSVEAATQVLMSGYTSVPAEFYISSADGYCKGEGFDGRKLPLNGTNIWPND